MPNIANTLSQRQHTHGSFPTNADCAQELKKLCARKAVKSLNSTQWEAIENICQKLARILTGNPDHADNWHDIAGYATLAEQEVLSRETK